MSRPLLFAILPLLAAVLVFGPGLLSFDGEAASTRSDDANPRTTTTTTTTTPARTESGGAKPIGAERFTSNAPSTAKLGASLALVLVLAALGIVVCKRLQNSSLRLGPSANITIKETRRLGKGRALHYMRVADRLLLVAESECGVQLVQDLTPSDASKLSDLDAEGDGAALFDDDDDGVTPADLLPRPTQRATQRPAQRTSAEPRERKASLSDFRSLLSKLG